MLESSCQNGNHQYILKQGLEIEGGAGYCAKCWFVSFQIFKIPPMKTDFKSLHNILEIEGIYALRGRVPDALALESIRKSKAPYCNSPSRILEVYQVDMVTLEDKSEAKELMA